MVCLALTKSDSSLPNMKHFIRLCCALLVVQMASSLRFSEAHSNNSGAPVGYTGSPNENNARTCASQNGGCHSGTGTTFQQGMITSNVPACGYTPGQTYTITVSITVAGRNEFGFSISPQLTSGATAGTMIASTGTQLNGNGRYLTHTAAGSVESEPNTRVWSFDWIAPAAGSGQVTFYAALNASNSNDANSGDLIFNSNLNLFEGQTPESPIIFGEPIGCEGSPITLSTNYTEGIVWTPGNASTQEISVNQPGIYQVTVTNPCGTSTSEPINVTFEAPPPTPDILFSSGDAGLESSITGPYLYTWYQNGVPIPDATSAVFVPTDTGSYTLSLTSFNGCSSGISEPIVLQTVGLNGVLSKPQLSVFPNPSPSFSTITLVSARKGTMQVRDATGRKVLELQVEKGKTTWNSTLIPGVYYLSMAGSVQKIVIAQ